MNQHLIDYILLIGSFQAFFLTALLIKKREKALHDFIIGAWLIFLGLYFSLYALSPTVVFLRNPWLVRKGHEVNQIDCQKNNNSLKIAG